MLDSYNSNFTPVVQTSSQTVSNVVLPDEPGFNQEDLLYDTYIVAHNSTLNLAAPPNCTGYEWFVQNPATGSLDNIDVKTMNGSSATTRRFVVYIPKSGLSANTYRLGLRVRSPSNKIYTDYCNLVVYQNYFYDTGQATLSRAVTNPQDRVQTVARTIIPDAINLNSEDLRYFIYGENTVSKIKIGPIEVQVSTDENDSSGKTGFLYLDFPKADYFFTLMAISSEPERTDSYEYLKGISSLVGYANADLRYSQDATFVLKAENTGSLGQANLKVWTENWNLSDSEFADVTVSASLQDNSGNTVIPFATQVSLSNSNITSLSAPENPNYSITAAAGSYYFVFSAEKNGTLYTWKDELIILSDTNTNQEIAIPPIIPTGYADFKIYTKDWALGDSDAHSGFSVSTDVKRKSQVSETEAQFSLLNMLEASELTSAEPDTANFGISAELGNYILYIFFTKDSDSFSYAYQFSIEAGKTVNETVEIPSSVIPLDSGGG